MWLLPTRGTLGWGGWSYLAIQPSHSKKGLRGGIPPLMPLWREYRWLSFLRFAAWGPLSAGWGDNGTWNLVWPFWPDTKLLQAPNHPYPAGKPQVGVGIGHIGQWLHCGELGSAAVYYLLHI